VTDWEPEVRRRLAGLWQAAVIVLGEDEARASFIAVTKRGHGKRGLDRGGGRKRGVRHSTTAAAARMRQRRLRNLIGEVSELSEADIRDQHEKIAALLSNI
jgi:hypothetical protein